MAEYKKPSVTADVVLFRCIDVDKGIRKGPGKELQVLLIKRNVAPCKNQWSLPGGFVSCDDGMLLETAKTKLKAKAGISEVYLEQLKTFDALDRDPRGRVISVAYLGLAHDSRCIQTSGTCEAKWFKVCDIGVEYEISGGTAFINGKNLAFDHWEIIKEGIERLRGKLEYSDIVFELLPEKFTIKEAQQIFEVILGYRTDSFRRKLGHRVTETNEYVQRVGKPAKLFIKTPIDNDYSKFGVLTPYQKNVVDKLRLEGVLDNDILIAIKN